MASNLNSITMNPYQELGISNDASELDIKRAYKKAALNYHPDRQQHASSSVSAQTNEASRKEAEDKMARINEAYGILKDPDRKQRFDHILKYGGGGGGFRFGNDDDNVGGSTGTRTSTRTRSTRRTTTTARHERQRRHESFFANEASFPHSSNFPNRMPTPSQRSNGDGTESEVHFQIPYGRDPFLHIPANYGQGGSDADADTSKGGFSFTFSSTASHSVDSNGTLTYVRNVSNYRNGWKETLSETVTVERGNGQEMCKAIYRNHLERTKAEGPVQWVTNRFFSAFTNKKSSDLPNLNSSKPESVSKESTSTINGQQQTGQSESSENEVHGDTKGVDSWRKIIDSAVSKCADSCAGTTTLLNNSK